MSGDVTFIPESRCPHCGMPYDATGPTRGDAPHGQPEPGDPCICFRCGVVLVFVEGNRLRRAEPGDFDAETAAFVTQERERLRVFRQLHEPQVRPDEKGRWPCGCRTRAEGEVFVVAPCSRRCPVYRTAIRAVLEKGLPVRWRTA